MYLLQQCFCYSRALKTLITLHNQEYESTPKYQLSKKEGDVHIFNFINDPQQKAEIEMGFDTSMLTWTLGDVDAASVGEKRKRAISEDVDMDGSGTPISVEWTFKLPR